MASPMASWKPSLAPLRKRNGWLAIGEEVVSVAEFVMNGDEVVRGVVDADFEADVVVGVDIPGAGVADDVAIGGAGEHGPLPEGVGQRFETE